MTLEEREKFYDSEIAPALLGLVEKCLANGLSLVAMTEWEPGETGRTVGLNNGAGFGIRMAEAAMRAHGNVDSFLLGMMKHAQENGHGSIYLKMLGVPTSSEKSGHQ